jgi:hypothetical protein
VKRTPLLVALAVFTLLSLGAVEAGAAEELLPEDFSAADQYVESVPTGDGGRPAAGGAEGKGGLAPLPPSAAGKIEDGSLLERVASSPGLGAPSRSLGKRDDASAEPPSVPSAAVGSLDGGDGADLLWLLIAVAIVSAVIGGAALNRYHRRGKVASGT